LADVICDTSFLVHVNSVRVRNIGSLDTEIGDVSLVVPDVVLAELERLAPSSPGAARALGAARAGRTISIGRGAAHADAAIVAHVRRNGGIVATMDRALKRAVRRAGGSVMSVSRDRIVIE